MHLPEHLLFAGAERGLGGFLRVGVDVGQGVVAVDDPQPVPVLALGALQGGLDPRAEGAFEVRELDDGHRRVLRSEGREAVGGDVHAERFEPVVDREPLFQHREELALGALLRLLPEELADLARHGPQRVRDAALVLAIERRDRGVLDRRHRLVHRGQDRLHGHPGAAGFQVEQALVHELPEERLQHLGVAPVRFDLAAQAFEFGLLQGERRYREELGALHGVVADGRHHVVVRPQGQSAGEQQRQSEPERPKTCHSSSEVRSAHSSDLSRSALAITDTDDRLIATAAMTGASSTPTSGYSTPAATGTPTAL